MSLPTVKPEPVIHASMTAAASGGAPPPSEPPALEFGSNRTQFPSDASYNPTSVNPIATAPTNMQPYIQPPPIPPPSHPMPPALPGAPSNCYLTPEGDRFYVTLLQMAEKGSWVPITQIAIFDPGFVIPPVSRIEFKAPSTELGTSKYLTESVLRRYYSVDTLLYNDTTITPEQQAKYTKEYRKFFQHLSEWGGRERFARIDTGLVVFYLKGPDIKLARQFDEREPVLCFFQAPSPEWTPSELVNPPLDPQLAAPPQLPRLQQYADVGYQQPPRLTPPILAPQQQIYPGSNYAQQPTATTYPLHYLPPHQQASAPMYVPTTAYPAQPTPNVQAPMQPPIQTPVAPPMPPPQPATAAIISNVTSSATAAPPAPSTAVVPAAGPPASTHHQSSTVLMSHHFLRDLTHQHDWCWGAIAELVHNARDAGAKNCKVLVRRLGPQKEPHLIVDDDGSGMTHAELRHALMFGRVTDRKRGKDTIGKFGFGLKHGTMRLGDDVLVLTRAKDTFSIGLLSQTYNKSQSSVKAPIITRFKEGNQIDYSVMTKQEADEAEEVMRRFSVFDHFMIGQQLASMAPRGTRIIVWKLRKSEVDPEEEGGRKGKKGKRKMNGKDESTSDSDSSSSDSDSDSDSDPAVKARKLAHKAKLLELKNSRPPMPPKGDEMYELKFLKKEGDIQLVIDEVSNMQERSNQMSTDVPLDYSLRAYLSMLFLDEKMKMYVQGKLVEHLDWEKYLTKTKRYPCPLKYFEQCKLLLGYSEEEKNRGNAGMMLYWHATLIETYRRVGIQTGNSDAGLGVIGVLDMGDKVEPNNNKQRFPQSDKYFKRILKWLAQVLDSYWHDVLKQDIIPVVSSKTLEKLEEQGLLMERNQAVECERCKKWRAISQREMDIIDGKINADGTPGDGKERKWFCYMNRDPRYNSCAIPQDPFMEDPDELVIKVSRGGGDEVSVASSEGSDEQFAAASATKSSATSADKNDGKSKNVFRLPNPAVAGKHQQQEKGKVASATVSSPPAKPRPLLKDEVFSLEEEDVKMVDATSSASKHPPKNGSSILSASSSSGVKRKQPEASASTSTNPVAPFAKKPKPAVAKHSEDQEEGEVTDDGSDEQGDSDETSGDEDDDPDEPLLDIQKKTPIATNASKSTKK